MVIVGEQIFVRIEVKETEDCERHFMNKNIEESTYKERTDSFNRLSKGQIRSLAEELLRKSGGVI